VAPTELARAKVNLFLHVGQPSADGYHDLSSLMVFADVGDRVTLRPGGSGFTVTGPFASGLVDEGDNLVTRARDLFLTRFGGNAAFGLMLEKSLPIAAGLGGGSADAAAALRLMAGAFDLPFAERCETGAMGEIARMLGADVAACLGSTPVMAKGRGDVLTASPPLPVLHAVLVNPGAPSPTAAVYRAFDEDRAWAELAAPRPGPIATPAETVRWLSSTRNDLEAPAIRLCPEIGEVIAALRRSDGCLMARMSGSGATCFALCEDEAGAARLAESIARSRPAWWVAACRFGQPARD
jgi:4-diphosphocytidyl-2-C-methyl-D-erythritol kinase